MSKGIDYSRWDNIGSSSDDASGGGSGSDEDMPAGPSHPFQAAPAVQRLQQPTSVTIGPGGLQVASASHQAQATSLAPIQETGERKKPVGSVKVEYPERDDTCSPTAPPPAFPRAFVNNGRTTLRIRSTSDASAIGADLPPQVGGIGYYWCQSRDAAIVSIVLGACVNTEYDGEREEEQTQRQLLGSVKVAAVEAAELRIDGTPSVTTGLTFAVTCGPSASAESAQFNAVAPAMAEETRRVTARLTTCVTAGAVTKLAVHYPLEEESEDLTDGTFWELVTVPMRACQGAMDVVTAAFTSDTDETLVTPGELSLAVGHVRVLRVTLPKKRFGMGAYLWWDRVFVADPEAARIDVKRDIEDRAGQAGQDRMRETWAKAHELFKDRVKERKEGSMTLDQVLEKLDDDEDK